MRQSSLTVAVLLSIAVHLSGLLSPGWDLPADDLPPGEALRLEARVAPPLSAPAPQEAIPAPAPKPRTVPKQPPEPVAETPTAVLPPAEPDEPVASASGPVAESYAPTEPELSLSEPVASQSSVVETQTVSRLPIAQRLPRQGRVLYSGTAGGFLSLGATGLASWEHDGVRFQSRLSAGLTSRDSSLDYRSTGRFGEDHLISETTSDKRMSKFSTALIDQAGGKVSMQRGADSRERSIKGLAIALSALPQLLMTLDESIEKAAFFVVGDFWVEDSVLIARGAETLRLPAGRVETRHYQSRSPNGKLVDVWLALAWRNAPARIRIEADGLVVDLKASLVEIDGQVLALEPEPEPQE